MELNPEQERNQRALIHQAICGIAAVCDGAVTLDNQGFDGGDTKWGRGIAAVPAEDWTDEDYFEAARLLNKYSRQGEIVLGFDPRTLSMVHAHAEDDTHYGSREHSRAVRRAAAARERGAAKIAQRKATLNRDGSISIGWVKGDPDFNEMRDRARALPQRRFDGPTQMWVAAGVTQALVDLIEEFDLAADFEPRVLAEAAAKAEAEHYHLTLEYRYVVLRSSKQDAFRAVQFRGEWQQTKDIFKLSLGFRWNNPIEGVWQLPEEKMNTAVLEAAAACGFKVHPDVVALAPVAEKASAEAQNEAESLQALLSLASRAKDINDLPEAFRARVAAVLAR